MCYWIWFVNILSEDFCISIHQEYWSVFFLCCVFFCFWYQSSTGIKKWGENVPSCLIIWKCLRRIGIFFKCFGEFFPVKPPGPRLFFTEICFYFLICCHCSVSQLCPTLCDSMDCSMSGFPVLHHLLELAQTHVHWVSDAIQPSHPLSSPCPPAFNLFQHHGLF